MSVSFFNHVRIRGIKTSLPEHYIDIDDELQYFGNNPKKLDRQKKMIGYGRRYIADDRTTVTDLACDAASKLMDELHLEPGEIGLLLFVNQKPDYLEPCDANIAHGRLGLAKACAAMNINMGCSGYVYALWTAHAFISSGAVKSCLLLAGDLCGRATDQTNRKVAPVFGDAASATYLEYTEEERRASFVMGADGTGWDKIIRPFGGMRLPYDKASFDIRAEDADGNVWDARQGLMKGEDVFRFTMDVAPSLIRETMKAATWMDADVDLYALHQANRQILDMIVLNAGISPEKAPVDVFSKYANNSTSSIVTVLCDQPAARKLDHAILCVFGVGLSWGGAALDLSGIYNGGISTYRTPPDLPSREQQIAHWIKYFKGEC